MCKNGQIQKTQYFVKEAGYKNLSVVGSSYMKFPEKTDPLGLGRSKIGKTADD